MRFFADVSTQQSTLLTYRHFSTDKRFLREVNFQKPFSEHTFTADIFFASAVVLNLKQWLLNWICWKKQQSLSPTLMLRHKTAKYFIFMPKYVIIYLNKVYTILCRQCWTVEIFNFARSCGKRRMVFVPFDISANASFP